jgi:hypothetical protein
MTVTYEVLKMQANAWAEGFAACAEWWEIHHYQAVIEDANPYRKRYEEANATLNARMAELGEYYKDADV